MILQNILDTAVSGFLSDSYLKLRIIQEVNILPKKSWPFESSFSYFELATLQRIIPAIAPGAKQLVFPTIVYLEELK